MSKKIDFLDLELDYVQTRGYWTHKGSVDQ